MQQQARISLFISVIAIIFWQATAQVFNLAGCPQLQGVDYMDYEKFAGIWYEFARTPRPLHPSNARCVTYIMDTPVKGEKFTKRLQIDASVLGESQQKADINSKITGAGKILTPDLFEVTYLNADYDEYVVAYGCQDYIVAKQEVTWILTRERFPSCELILRAYNKIAEFGLSLDAVRKTNQTDCPETWDGDSGLLPQLRG